MTDLTVKSFLALYFTKEPFDKLPEVDKARFAKYSKRLAVFSLGVAPTVATVYARLRDRKIKRLELAANGSNEKRTLCLAQGKLSSENKDNQFTMDVLQAKGFGKEAAKLIKSVARANTTPDRRLKVLGKRLKKLVRRCVKEKHPDGYQFDMNIAVLIGAKGKVSDLDLGRFIQFFSGKSPIANPKTSEEYHWAQMHNALLAIQQLADKADKA